MAVGVMPETKLARDAGLEIGETGCIKVNAKRKARGAERKETAAQGFLQKALCGGL